MIIMIFNRLRLLCVVFVLRFVSKTGTLLIPQAIWPLILFTMLGFSCTSTKKIQYFQDMPDSSVVHLEPLKADPRIITGGDRLLISFGSRDPGASEMFNHYGGVSSSISDQPAAVGAEVTGFIVDDNGFLQFPLIGQVKAAGLTSMQLKDLLTKEASLYLKDPYVVVRYYDFKVTVLGEVKLPGTYSLTQNKPSLFHALGASGDLARSGKRYDVEIFRDYNGSRTISKVDLRSKNILNNSQNFLLQNNDVIYVQPRKGGLAGENSGLITGILSMVISLATLIVTIKR